MDTERPSLTVPEPDPTGPDRSSGGRWSAGFVLTGILAGLAGAGIVAGILLASGARVEKHVTSVVTEQSQSSAAELEPAAVYAEAAPGVVDITARIVTVVQTPVGPRSESGVSIGAGSVISRKGDVVTAEHVVKGARSVTVKLQNGTVRKAKILGRDPATDIAVLKIDPSGLRLHPVELGSSKSLRIGDPIFAIGDPFGYDRSLSGGLVSALDRTIVAPNGFNVAHAIQTDTALNPGNSGGPLLDAQGRLVGIADQIATGGSAIDTNTGVSFGIPVDLVKADLADLERGVIPAHAYLGIDATDATPSGALVQSIQARSPAARAGIKQGDVIVALDGVRVSGVGDLVSALAARHPGERITLTVRRGSRQLPVGVTLARQPSSAAGSG